MANVIYNSLKKAIGDGTVIDWANATTVKVMLLDDTHTVDIDTHDFKDDIDATGDEITGTGYTAGGAVITTRTITVDTANDWAEYDGDDVTWGSSTITARYGVVYKDTGVASTSPLICFVDFGSNKSSSNGDFKISWHADGVFKLA